MVGNAEYRCSCIRYVPRDIIKLVVGISVGVGVFLLIIIAIIDITVVWCRRQRQMTTKQESKDDVKKSTYVNYDEGYYSNRLPENDIRKSTDLDGTYSTRLPDDFSDSRV